MRTLDVGYTPKSQEEVRAYRETSRQTWNTIKSCKMMAGSHADLLECLIEHFPITVAEITPIYNRKYGYDFGRNEVAKRMSNLVHNYKVALEVGERFCTVNGKIALEFIPSNATPEKLSVKKSKKQIIEELTKENEDLRRQVAALQESK